MEVSVKSLLSNMTRIMAALSTIMDAMEEGGKKRKVDFRGDPPASCVTVPVATLRAPPGLPALSTSQERLEMAHVGSVPPLLPSTSCGRPEMTPESSLPSCQPSTCQERQAMVPTGTLPPCLPFDSQERPEIDPWGEFPQRLPDVSDACEPGWPRGCGVPLPPFSSQTRTLLQMRMPLLSRGGGTP